MTDFLQTAIDYHDAGLVVIPWSMVDGKVMFPKWTQYQFGQKRSDVELLFSKPSDGIALVCTNGIEVIDIDVKADPKETIGKDFFEDLFWRTGSDEIRKKCVIVKTKSNGWHIIYKTAIPEGNTKLASRKGCKEAMIETRGPGGLVFVAPTPGYTVKQGDYKEIQILTDAERNILIETAISLDENPEEVKMIEKPVAKPQANESTSLTPWDDYVQKTDLVDLMESYGWKVSGNSPSGKIHLSKPDASNPRDTHAVIIKTSDNTPIFHPFTTGTKFEPRKNYNAFHVYTLMNHYGDSSQAAKKLYDDGFGERSETNVAPSPAKEQPKKPKTDILAFVKSTKFDVTAPIREEAAILTLTVDGKTYKVGGKGQMGVIVGEQKSGKSLVTSCIAASGLSGGDRVLNFSLDIRKKMEYFDTEQSSYFYQLTQKRLHELAGIKRNHPNYAAYLLRRLSIKDRMFVIDEMLKDRKDLSCIIIDGAVDLCTNFNDEKASTEVADKLLQWSDQTGAMLITVLHTTKSMGYLRGHLGTALQNKADFVIQAKQDKTLGVYTVECRESRFAPFPSFDFVRDDKGFPVFEKDQQAQDDEPEPEPSISTLPSQKVADNIEIPF